MKLILERLVRSADDGGSGGGGTGDAADGNGESAAAGETPAAPAVEGAQPTGDAGNAPVEPFKPDGLPGHLLGKSDQETMTNMAKALKGYRERDSQNEIPKDVSAYSTFPDDLPDAVKPHIQTLTNDQLFSRVAEEAHKLEIPPAKFQQLTTTMMSVAAEMGIMEPPIDVEAERAALVPEGARHLPPAEQKTAREQRMNDNFGYLDQLANRGDAAGGIGKDTADFVKAMLGDSARGHQFIEYVRKQSGGGSGPVIANNGSSASNAREELMRRAGLPENNWGNPKFNQGSYDQLLEDYKKLVPEK